MDWSTIYEDHGEEVGDWDFQSFNVRLRPLSGLATRGQYRGWTMLVFTVNYILGVGCLGMPFAFMRSGLLLGPFLITLVTILSGVTVHWVVEAIERAKRLENAEIHSKTPALGEKKWKVFAGSRIGRKSPVHRTSEEKLLVAALEGYGSLEETGRALSFASEDYRDDGHYEVTKLCELFLGDAGKIMYQLSLMGLMYVGLIAYTQVFAKSVLSQIPLQVSSLLVVIFFGAIVVPLSCCDLEDQVFVQVLTAVLRFVSLGIMIVGALVAMWIDPNPDPDPWDGRRDAAESELVNFAGFGLMFSTALFSQLFQHSVPGLLAPLPAEEHRPSVVRTSFFSALAATWTIYILLSVPCVLYFRHDTEQSINLNFDGFTWGVPRTSLAYGPLAMLSKVVVLFPAMDTLSVFPLIANTLGNNFAASVSYRIAKMRYRRFFGARLQRGVWKTGWRLMAAVPPLGAALLFTDLSLTLQFAGIFGVVVAFVTPSLLQRASILEYERNTAKVHKASEFRPEKGMTIAMASWTLPCTGTVFADAMLCFSGFALVVIGTQISQACRVAVQGD